MPNAILHYPFTIHHKRDARNSHIPQAPFKSRLIRAQNHAMAYRRKYFGSWGDFDNRMSGDSATDARFRWRCHTGHGKDVHIVVEGIAGLHDTVIGAPVDPAVNLICTAAGGAALPTETFHYGNSDGSPTDAPDEWGHFKLRVPVSANTTYECVVNTVDYGRILSMSAYEEASPVIDTGVDYYVQETATSVGFPVFDQQREDQLVGLSNMWRHNAGHLYSYMGPSTGVLSPGTTWQNLFDGSTTITSASPRVTLYPGSETPVLGRASDSSGTVIDVVFAAYAQATGGNTGEIRLRDPSDSVTLCSLTGITTTLQWHTTTATITDLQDIYEAVVEFRNSNGAHSIQIDAISLYLYLA